MVQVTQSFRSRFGFLMASIGFAVGLGNIWRFPYVTGENGGSAFVVVYLVCAFLIGVPILMAEIMIGRRGKSTPSGSMLAIATSEGRTPAWRHVGHLNLATAFCILIAYSVVAGWVLYYLYRAVTGTLIDHDPVAAAGVYDLLLEDIPAMLLWSFLAIAIAAGIVYAGVEKGIERAVSVLMPILFLLLLVLVIYNIAAGGMGEAVDYLFSPDFSKVTPATGLAAIGQAFFSIGVGMAGMMMFGAYLPDDVSIAKSAVLIVIADTCVALIAGLVIFPMVFANGLDPGQGTGLIFQTLPVAFAQMPGGEWVALVFFLLLSVAAVTSIVGLFEPIGAWCAARFGWSRHRSALTVVAAGFALSIPSTLSYNVWADAMALGKSLGGWIDFIPNSVFLPLGGALIALFAGWFMTRSDSAAELGIAPAWFNVWFNLTRVVVVPAVLIILVTGFFA
jgi:NSS family neurotransmitter:Na+ symporter